MAIGIMVSDIGSSVPTIPSILRVTVVPSFRESARWASILGWTARTITTPSCPFSTIVVKLEPSYEFCFHGIVMMMTVVLQITKHVGHAIRPLILEALKKAREKSPKYKPPPIHMSSYQPQSSLQKPSVQLPSSTPNSSPPPSPADYFSFIRPPSTLPLVEGSRENPFTPQSASIDKKPQNVNHHHVFEEGGEAPTWSSGAYFLILLLSSVLFGFFSFRKRLKGFLSPLLPI